MCSNIRWDGWNENFLDRELNRALMLYVCVTKLIWSRILKKNFWCLQSRRETRRRRSRGAATGGEQCCSAVQHSQDKGGPPCHCPSKQAIPRPCSAKKHGFCHCSTFVFILQTLSNHGVTKLKRFISQISDKLCDKESWKFLRTKQGFSLKNFAKWTQ